MARTPVLTAPVLFGVIRSLRLSHAIALAAACTVAGQGLVAVQEVEPAHLRDRPFELSVRRDGHIVPAPPELLQLARGYPAFAPKGPVEGGRRITVMTERQHYKLDEAVHVVHVLEALDPTTSVYAMGPKPVYEEYVDGIRATPPAPDAGLYDGVVLKGPAVDFNYEISTYTFRSPGRHTIEWRDGGAVIERLRDLHSNVLVILVD
jgi:hypothetical protein